MPRQIFETPRLRLRELAADDAPFIVELLNDADFLRFIGDRGVRDEQGALRYLESGPLAMYAEHGFGLWMVERSSDGAAIGICGLLKRASLDDVDVGYALLPAYRGQGYARESVIGTLEHARTRLGLRKVVAIVTTQNRASIALLTRVGMRFERLIQLSPDAGEVALYSCEAVTPE